MKPVREDEKILFEAGENGTQSNSDSLVVTNRRIYHYDKTLSVGTINVIDVEDVKKLSYRSDLTNYNFLVFLILGILLLGAGISLLVIVGGLFLGVSLVVAGSASVLISTLLFQKKGLIIINYLGGEMKINLINPDMFALRDAIFVAKDEMLDK